MRATGIAFAAILLLSSVGQAASEADEYFADAQKYVASGDLVSAVIQLKNALQSDPAHARSRLMLGRIYLDIGDAVSAEKELRRARALGLPASDWELPLGEAYLAQRKAAELLSELTMDGSRPAAHQAQLLALRGRAHLQHEEFEAAGQAFDAALALDPRLVAALVGKAQLYERDGDKAAALRAADAAVASDPANADAYVLRASLRSRDGQRESALQDLNKALELDPGHARALYQRAGFFTEQRQHEAALADIAALQKHHPDSPSAGYLQAVVAFQQGDFDKAQELAGDVLRAVPQHDRSLVLYGVSALIKGQEEIARDYLQRARALGARQRELDILIAAIQLRAGSYDRVIELFGPDALRSDDVRILVLLGSAYLGKGEDGLGGQAFGRAIELAPTLPQLRTQLGISLLAAGQGDRAMDVLQSAIALAGDSVQPDLILVLGHLQLGDIDKAREAALALEQRRPDQRQVQNLVGVVLLADGQPDEARRRFERILAEQPADVSARINLARVHLANKDDVAAAGEFEEILQREPTNFDALIGMLALADRAGDTERVLTWGDRALQARPQAIQPRLLVVEHLLRMGRGQQALDRAAELASDQPDNPTVLYHYARAQIVAGNGRDALVSLRRAAQLQPESKAVWLLLATTQLRSGDLGGARDAVGRVLGMEPQHVEALATLAAIELGQGNTRRALDIAQDLQAAQPERAEGHRLVGMIQARSGQPAAAEAALRRAYALEKSGEVARFLGGLLAGDGRVDDAAKLLLDWLRQAPGDLEARRELAVMYQQAGLPAQAAVHYEALLERSPRHFAALNNLAWIRYEAGDPTAVELAQRAYEIAPDNPLVMDTYGWILFKTGGEVRQALRLLKQARVMAPTNPDIAYHTAVLLSETGDREQARAALRTLLARHPGFPEAGAARALLTRLGG